MYRGDGVEYDSEQSYSSEKQAYEAARHELKLLRKEIAEENARLKYVSSTKSKVLDSGR